MTRFFAKKVVLFVCGMYTLFLSSAAIYADDLPLIDKVIISGNALIPEATILHRLPYRAESLFDEAQSTKAIEALYSLGAFEQIMIEKEVQADGRVSVFVTVTEKPTLASISFSGNKALSTKKLEEIIDAKNVRAINEESAKLLAVKIKKEYQENDYHQVDVQPTVTIDPENPQRATLSFTITENQKSHIRHIDFIGNTIIPSRTIRSFIQNREAWVFGFLNGAGKYDKSALEIDKERVRMLYMDRGYFTARVTNTSLTQSPDKKAINIIFTINEGPQFTVSSIDIAPDEKVPHRIVRRLLTLAPGDVYKHSEMHKMMESIKKLYGEYGFIDAYVSPSIVPDTNAHTVAITFHVDKGTQWRLNRIFVTGNDHTRDHVIRRQLVLDEGALITSTALDVSKQNVEYLSYFDRESVTWEKHRITNDLMDLELKVKEVPTREFNLGIDFGASQQDPNAGLKGFVSTDLRNMLGQGWDAGFVVKGSKATLSQFSMYVSDPYLRHNLSAQLQLSFNRTAYDTWRWVSPSPTEQVVGLVGRLGTRLPTPDRRTTLHLEAGIQKITNNAYIVTTNDHGDPVYTSRVTIASPSPRDHARLQALLEQKLQAGTVHWVGFDIIKDTRNHLVYPNDGYRIAFSNKIAVPVLNKTFSYLKTSLEASWYTPLIGYDTLVLGLHGFAGMVEQIGLGQTTYSKIPYRELFHIGGENTLRGFNYSQAGPSWRYANPLGGKKAIYGTAELVFPLLSNYDMKIHLFYDFGCAFDTPKTQIIRDNASDIKGDSFHLRHTIGIGLNIIKPQPMKISFGYKLDRNKRIGETPSEFHIGINSAF